MYSDNGLTTDKSLDQFGVKKFLWRQAYSVFGAVLLVGLVLAVVSIASWNVSDPSFSLATSREPTNALGYTGAAFADLAMQFFGLGAVFALITPLFWGVALWRKRPLNIWVKRVAAWFAGSVLCSAVLSCFSIPESWPLPNGLGGVFGDLVLRIPAIVTGDYPSGIIAVVLALSLVFPVVWLMLFAMGVIERPENTENLAPLSEEENGVEAHSLHEQSDSRLAILMGAIAHRWYMLSHTVSRKIGSMRKAQNYYEDEYETPDLNEYEFSRLDGVAVEPMVHQEPVFDGDSITDNAMDPSDDIDLASDWAVVEKPPYDASIEHAQTPSPRVFAAAQPLKQSKRTIVEAQPALISDFGFELPAVHMLEKPKKIQKTTSLSAKELEQNARMLEGVLADFGVKGEIAHVRPGPVVTLYELEPAPGIKSSRVIGLADDIARSMSAIAARVAVVPGRNAIGIELPNSMRETVFLSELIGSQDFEKSKAKLALSLGKNIGGEPVIADLAKMPHLLVAGTTGSGKSVAINTMILSLLYRMDPSQCRLIMIDPKMLELSVYDGIPHLLTPVVTDPKKAVVALKWTVREMENRYKKMSKIGVRNIDGFNSKLEQATKKGKAISRTVQTGFDKETGEAIYETEEFDLEPMPYIVVIIDEMADLMMVAGKDIEGTVQRLAQMARAAGIHVIMATQRPSVDVITGTIKANFPTRISFQVTSKIDSRTILGEQGAEQLLGMGDMLFMPGGSRTQRVHGPFVSDDDVEQIVAHLKSQGVPEYLDAIIEDDESSEDGAGPKGAGNLANSDDPYDQAVAIVLRDGKASTSYIQRRMGIGYNRAATLIERMEEEGVIGAANHAGKREILVPTEKDIMGVE